MEITPCVIRYHFSQSFAVSARLAYRWCTDFTPEDHALMGENNVERQVVHVEDDLLVLKEIFHKSSDDVEKQKLVHLYPDQLSWVSTHLTGPNKHSQFTYELLDKGNNTSCLNFSAHHVEYQKEIMTRTDIEVLADNLCKSDSEAWKLLAKTMEKELKR